MKTAEAEEGVDAQPTAGKGNRVVVNHEDRQNRERAQIVERLDAFLLIDGFVGTFYFLEK